MTEKEYDDFTEGIYNQGFRFFPSSLHNANGYWYKNYGKSKYEQGRSNYAIMFLEYNWSEYQNRDPYLRENPYSVSAEVNVSRNYKETVELLLNDHCLEVPKLEGIAEKFFEWCEENIMIRD